MPVEITNEDYRPEDWDTVVEAGGAFMGALSDIAFHNVAAGDGWSPWAETSDTVGLVAEVRRHVDRMDEAVRQARAGLARAERTARLRAARRQR
jgi:hypothetical protein